jgi:hypothetical protein
MSASKSPYRLFRLGVVALFCALPFLIGSVFLYRHVERVDTLPLDRYGGLRWMPGEKNLAFLHQPLRQTPPAETELWRVTGTGAGFQKVGALDADREWSLSKNYSGAWMLLYGKKSSQDVVMALADGDGKVKTIEPGDEWQILSSQGDGLFFQTTVDDLPFDQFVDVEDAPDLQPEEETWEEDPWGREEEAEPAAPPTRLGLKIGVLNPETEEMETALSIPYDKPEQKPEVQLVRRSPDQRFIALIVRFGPSGSPGLWVYDSQTERLLWTRLLIAQEASGLDWSSDSVKVAVTDKDGLSLLENALGFESTQLKISASEPLLPSWGAGTNLYLFNQHIVYLVAKDREQAQPLIDSQDSDSSDLALDSVGGRAAFTMAPRGYRELVVLELKTGQNLTKVALPGSIKEKAQGTMVYQLGNAIRFAWRRWTGRG